MSKKELWLKIKNYHFEHIVPPSMWDKMVEIFGGTDASTKAFADKISRKHGCSKNYALKAVMEYKKFLYLAVISNFHVTPSKAIDKVWHEHILFTKAYRIFCDEIIEYNLNHHPELFPVEEQTMVYHAQYLDTLNLYAQEFGIIPPDDIWEISKFDKEKITENLSISAKKKPTEELYYSSTSYNSDIPLYQTFDTAEVPSSEFPEFNDFGGGDGSGGGAEGSWGGDADCGSDGGSDGGGCSGGCGGGD